MKNEASYLRPIRSATVAPAGTFTVGNFSSVVRILAPAATTVLFGDTGALVAVPANFPEYFRVQPGAILTATLALEIAEMG